MSQESQEAGSSHQALDLLWVATVRPEHLLVTSSALAQAGVFDPDARHPVHGTITVEVHSPADEDLLRRMLDDGCVLSITSADGWSQRVRLTALRHVTTEPQSDGDHLVVATYAWIAAASVN